MFQMGIKRHRGLSLFPETACPIVNFEKILVLMTKLFFGGRSICCKVLCKVTYGIAFHLKFTGVERDSARSLRPYAQGMVRVIRSETGFLYLLGREISRELMDHRAYDFKMGELFRPYIRQQPGYPLIRHGIALREITHACGGFAVRSAVEP